MLRKVLTNPVCWHSIVHHRHMHIHIQVRLFPVPALQRWAERKQWAMDSPPPGGWTTMTDPHRQQKKGKNGMHMPAFNVHGWHGVPPWLLFLVSSRFAATDWLLPFACACVFVCVWVCASSSNTLHMVCAGRDTNARGLHCLLCCKLCGGTQISDMRDVTVTHVTAGSVPHTPACAFSHTHEHSGGCGKQRAQTPGRGICVISSGVI